MKKTIIPILLIIIGISINVFTFYLAGIQAELSTKPGIERKWESIEKNYPIYNFAANILDWKNPNEPYIIIERTSPNSTSSYLKNTPILGYIGATLIILGILLFILKRKNKG